MEVEDKFPFIQILVVSRTNGLVVMVIDLLNDFLRNPGVADDPPCGAMAKRKPG
jgi:hypothetical protein